MERLRRYCWTSCRTSMQQGGVQSPEFSLDKRTRRERKFSRPTQPITSVVASANPSLCDSLPQCSRQNHAKIFHGTVIRFRCYGRPSDTTPVIGVPVDPRCWILFPMTPSHDVQELQQLVISSYLHFVAAARGNLKSIFTPGVSQARRPGGGGGSSRSERKSGKSLGQAHTHDQVDYIYSLQSRRLIAKSSPASRALEPGNSRHPRRQETNSWSRFSFRSKHEQALCAGLIFLSETFRREQSVRELKGCGGGGRQGGTIASTPARQRGFSPAANGRSRGMSRSPRRRGRGC